MEVLLKQLELGQKVHRFRVKELRYPAYAIGGLMLYWAIKLEYNRQRELSEISLKKHRLSMPVYEMKDEDYINPPWSGAKYEEWKYRLIKCKGRQVHRKTILIPKQVNHYNGYAYIVPVINKEDEKLENQTGIFVNKGWMPHEYKDTQSRMRVEDAENQHEFIGMLNRGEEYSTWNFWKRGNAFDEQRWIWNNFYLPDMARALKLQNERALRQGVIEVIDRDETPLDEKNPMYYSRDLSLTKIFPHPKTFSGALQPSEARSDTRRKQFLYTVAALALFAY